MVEKAKQNIHEGDIFQIVLSNRLSAPFEGSLLNTYRILRTMNPSPYMFYFSGTDVEVAGASPETLVKLENGILHTFPLAGTRPRGKNEKEDEALKEELLHDEKEDFITVSVKVKHPHLTLGKIVFITDAIIVSIGGFIFKDVDGTIYGFIITYLLTVVIDKIMYGIDAGKMTLIVTEKGPEVAEKIDEYSGRGSTLLKGRGSYSGIEKEVVMCACNNKQMYTIRRIVREVDPSAFTVIMESNEVVGEGFKEE